jgi:hypothetical protein
VTPSLSRFETIHLTRTAQHHTAQHRAALALHHTTLYCTAPNRVAHQLQLLKNSITTLTVDQQHYCLRHQYAKAALALLASQLQPFNNQLTNFHPRPHASLNRTPRSTIFLNKSLTYTFSSLDRQDGGNPSKACHCRRWCLR